MTELMSVSSPLGEIWLAGRDDGLAGLWLEGQKYFLESLCGPTRTAESPILRQASLWLDRYFAGERPDPGELRLAPQGSAFRQIVWALLLEIPYGQLSTYGALAVKAAQTLGVERMSAQAVGGAVGHNPISIIIPCHRVVGSDGSLTGYAGGVDKKRFLLEHEGAIFTTT